MTEHCHRKDNSMNKVRLGVVGFGNMGVKHVDNIVNGKVPNMVIGAVCDNAPARLEAVKAKYPDMPVFADASELFKSGTCDAVIIATPHYDHPKLAIEALECGLHVITEKPAGVYTMQVKEMNEAAAKSDKKFGIMYNQRTNPVYQKLREMIQRGDLGHIKRVTWIITNWCFPVSQGTYLLDSRSENNWCLQSWPWQRHRRGDAGKSAACMAGRGVSIPIKTRTKKFLLIP